MNKNFKRIFFAFLCFLLIFEQSGFTQVAAELNIAGHLATLHSSIVQDKFRPLHLRYLSFNPLENNFQLFLDKGSTKNPSSQELETTTKILMTYFFVGLALPNDSFWVNLRPDSPDNIIDDYLAQTDVGKIMLEADLQLKKDTAQATSPQTPEGKLYWDKLYQKAGELFGSENITIPTLTRPWIVPGEIIIRETLDSAYIYKATLKVMLEQDYLKDSSTYSFKDPRLKALNEYSSQLIRELIIPKLTKELNTSKRYASLRQVYYSLILAQWFKACFQGKSSSYSAIIDRRDLINLVSKVPWTKTTYFREYQQSFKDGEYNLKEPTYTLYGQTVRSYFSGGVDFGTGSSPIMNAVNSGKIPASSAIQAPPGNHHIGIEYAGGSPANSRDVKFTRGGEKSSSPVSTDDDSEKTPPETLQPELRDRGWPGPMLVEARDLHNLGLGSRDDWTLETVFPEFQNAPDAVRQRLIDRLQHPRRLPQEVEASRRKLSAMMQLAKGFSPRKGLQQLARLSACINEYAETLGRFHRELDILRDAWDAPQRKEDDFDLEFFLSRNRQRDRRRMRVLGYRIHPDPYPPVMNAVVELGRLIVLLRDILEIFPDGGTGFLQQAKMRIATTLARKEVFPFLVEGLDDHLALYDPERFIEKAGWDNRTRNFDYSAIKQDPELLKLATAYADLAELRTPDEVRSGPITDAQRAREVSIKSQQYRHAFIRQMPDALLQSPLVELDFYARLAISILQSRQDYTFADLEQPAATIQLDGYVNPLLQRETNPQSTSIALGGGQHALLLSGPNMGGKTMTARGLGLAVLLNQMGLPLLAGAAKLGMFRNIYTVFPRPEQLQYGYGYFGALIEELTALNKKVGPGDLVILDEVPTGTDYDELVAVAVVLTEDFIKTGATVVVTGHLKKAFELLVERTGQPAYQHTTTEHDGQVVPNFHLAPGVAKRSYGIELTAAAGFPSEVTTLARAYYQLIMEGGTEIPHLTLPVEPAESVGPPTATPEPNDAEMIRTVMEHLYPGQHFAFTKTVNQLLAALFRSVEEEQELREALQTMRTSIGQETQEDEPLRFFAEDLPERRLEITQVFIAQGARYLEQLTERLAAVYEREEFSWGPPRYDYAKNMQRLERLAKGVTGVMEYVAQLPEAAHMTPALKALGKVVKTCTTLREKYADKQGTDLNPEKTAEREQLEGLQALWTQDWSILSDSTQQLLTVLDAYTGVARSVLLYKLQSPHFVEEPRTLQLRNSRPLFPTSWTPFVPRAVPQSFAINPVKPVFVLTGPNSSGKTVLMFNSRLNALFALRGFYVSGELTLSHFDGVFAFFGGENITLRGESYFKNILGHYALILREATPQSLVVLDELHGTDNFEMAAIQLAVLQYLRQKGCTVIFNTHIRDGLKLAAEQVGLDLWKTDVTYDSQTHTITPHYTVSPDPDLEAKSYGLAVASQWLTPEQYHRAVELYEQLTRPPAPPEPPAGAASGGEDSYPTFAPKAKGAQKSSSPAANLGENKTGGIDFRSLPIVIQAISNLSLNISRIPLSRLDSINLNQEWQEIQKMVESGITPSTDRIKEYVASSCLKGDLDTQKVVSCIANILRLEEEHCVPTDSMLRDILVGLESNRSIENLRDIFIGAKP